MKKQTVLKKVFSLVLGLAMVTGLAMPVMAAESQKMVFEWTIARVGGETIYITDILHNVVEQSQEPIRRMIDGVLTERTETVFWIAPSSLMTRAYDISQTTMRGSAGATLGLMARWDDDEFFRSAFWPMIFTDPAQYGVVSTTEAAGIYTYVLDLTDWLSSSTETQSFFEANPRDIIIPIAGGEIFVGVAVNGEVQTQPPTTGGNAAPNLSTASTWAHDSINQAFALGLIPQSLQNNYTANATRAEFSALAVALYETVTGREIAGRMQFNDTNDINVQKMGYLGVVSGVGGGNFAPNNTLTREQAAVMLARLADIVGQPLPPSAPTFADNAQISSWAIDGVGQMQAAGIMGGTGNNNFSPSGDYTREQSIITILRLFDILS